jgi:hypothetical protein
VLHQLTRDMREKMMEYAQVMLVVLHAAECDSWHRLVTDDESSFFLNRLPRRMWTLSRDDVITKLRFDIQSKNLCL